MFIVDKVVVRAICQCGMPMREDGPSGEPDDEHVETATEGEQGLGAFVGVVNAVILLAIGVTACLGIAVFVMWVVRHGR